MIIKIDYRESELITKITAFLSINPKESITVVSANLPLGDIIICDNADVEKVIIERKSLQDLAASIRDGRYKEQSFRLNECSMPNHNIFYLIEGNLQTYKPFLSKESISKASISKASSCKGNSIDKYALLSSLVSISYYKGFSLYKANSLDESAEWIIQLAYKLDKEGGQPFYTQNDVMGIDNGKENSASSNYVDVAKRTKKNNITTTNISEIMLSQIPNVSTTIAKAIMEKFYSMKQLIETLTLDSKALNNIVTPNKSGQFRKISKTSIENIYKYLLPHDNNITVDTK